MTLPATVAVDIGGTKIRAGSVIDGRLAHVRSVATPARAGAQAILDTVAEVAAAVIAETQASRDGSDYRDGSTGSSADLVWRIGVGSAGVIDPATGVVVSATDSLAGWAGTELTAELAARTGLPVRAVNDVHAHALGEAVAGASRGSSSSLLVAAGTGIGGGFITGGSLLTGRNSAAGHIGHLPSAAAAGLPCPCGGTGHVEAIASGPAILATYQHLRRADGPAISEPSAQSAGASPALDPTATSTRFSASSPANTRELAAAASAGDALAIRAFELGARALGSALGGIVNVLSPEVVVLGGGLAEMDSIWWVPLREAVAAELIPATAGVELRKAELGQDAALIGAAGLWDDAPHPTRFRNEGDSLMLSKTEILAALRGRLIVSVQAYPGEPMRDPNTMGQIAAAAVAGGAAAVRVQGLGDIQASRSAVEVPVIGLWKDGKDGVVITPTFQHAYAVALAGAQIVALDGTRRERPDGLSLAETVSRLHEQTNALVMADCGSLDDARSAVDSGADIIGTTLAGYTGERPKTDGPDLELISEIRDAALPAMLVAEGRIHSPAQAAAAREAGAETVVVGTAITHPTTITSWFAEAVED